MNNIYINEVKVIQSQEQPLSVCGQLEKFGDHLIGADRSVYQGKTYEIRPATANLTETSAPATQPKKNSLWQKATVNLGLFFKKTAAKFSPEIAAKYSLVQESDAEKQRNIYQVFLPKNAESKIPKKEGNGEGDCLIGCLAGCCQICAVGLKAAH